MIISASYKTDIPTFYGEWFLNRLRAGFCRMVNPYGRQVYTVDLRREAVNGFVFWTKNVGPFLAALAEVQARGYPFVLQHGVNGYPRELEHAVVDADRAVDHMSLVAERYGPRAVVWRYDTILFTSLTPSDWHAANFDRIARRLAGITDEVVISFAQLYRKTLRNTDEAARQSGFTWHDPPAEQKVHLVAELARIAKAYSMQLSVCSQRDYVVSGAAEARCIDARRLESVAATETFAKVQGNRPECMCHQSRDIGEYDTCPHGCVYCYAVRNRQLAQRRFSEHDPAGEFLFPP